MELPELYLNKMKLLQQLSPLFFTLILLNCKRDAVAIPDVWVSHSDTAFHIVNGIAYYKGSLYTGHLADMFDKNDTALSMCYCKGLAQGVCRQWYPNKQLAAERYFVNGSKEGVHKGWWENGGPRFEYHFLNDEYEGEVKEWNRAGSLYKIFHYRKGHEEGSEKLWWDDGRIRANYVVKNGERFGLTGQKLCKNNLSDSLFK